MINKQHNKRNMKVLTERGLFHWKYFLLCCSFLFLLNFISAQPPVTQIQSFPEGYSIIGYQQEYLKQGQDYQYNFFLENSSDGVLINNTSVNCTFYMADSTGEVKVFSDVPYFPDGHWGIDIDGANFSDVGIYCYGVRCSDGFGGHTTGCWEVTSFGKSGNDNIVFFVLIIIMLYTITFVGFFGKNIPISILGGMAMIGLGLYMITNGVIIYRDWLTNYFSYITIGLGALFSLWALVEEIQG